MTFQHRKITSADEWHEALTALPSPHPLQTYTWGAFKSRWGWQMKPVLFSNKNGPIAAALVLKRPIPRTPWSMLYIPKGPIARYEALDSHPPLLEALEQLGRAERAIAVKIDPDVPWAIGEEPSPISPGRELKATLLQRGWRFSAEQVQFKNTVLLDIARSEDEILADMKQKTRYNIRLATRKDVQIRRGTAIDWPLIMDLYRETAARDGFLIRPDAYYLDIWQSFYEAGQAQSFIAEYQGTPLSAIVVVAFNDRALYMYGASTDRERKRMPNYLLQWEAIRWAKTRGCTIYDFWGAPDQFIESDRLWGVWRFKKGFNGQVTHHIGAWDYPVNRPLYYLFTQALPRYRRLLQSRHKHRDTTNRLGA